MTPEEELARIDDFLDYHRAPSGRKVRVRTGVEGLEVEEMRVLSRVERMDALLQRLRRYARVMDGVEEELEMALSENRRLVLELSRRPPVRGRRVA